MNRLPTFSFSVWMVAAAAPIFLLLLLRIEQPATPPSDWPANCEIGAEMHKKEGATCPGCQLQNAVITTTSSGPCLWQVKIQVEPQPGIDMTFTPDEFELNETKPAGVSQGHISVDNDVLLGTYPLDVDVAPATGGQIFHIPLQYTLHVDPSVPPPTPIPTATPIPEEICSLTIQDGWMQPSQGVWQDDDVFPDRPTRQLVRLGPTAFRAELQMVLGRPTLLFGILRPVGEAALDRRNTIEIRGISRGTVNVPVRFRFSVEENGGPPREIYTSEVLSNTLPLLGPCRVDSRPFAFRMDATDGVPPPKSPDEPTAFTFNQTGSYRLIAEVVRADREPPNDRTGIRVTVEGTVVETHAPMLQFHPIILSPASQEEQTALKAESDFQARGSQLVVDDFFPLKPGTLVAVRHGVRDMSHVVQGVEEGTIAWIKRLFKDAIVARRDLLEAAINAERTLASLLGSGDRVVILMRNQDMDLVRPTAEGWASSPKVIFVRGGGGGGTVVHELAHTLPYLWSRTQMLEQCGRDWHNKPEAVAYGHQIQVFDQEKRQRHQASSTVMGDLVDKDSPRWIARCTYWNLLHILQAKPDPELLLVRGALVFSDTLSAGVLLPAYQTLGEPDLEAGDGGDWAIVLRNRGGERLARYPLNLQWVVAAHPDTVRQALTFAYQIDDGPEVARIDLVGPGEELLDTLPLSASSPEITLTHPVSGALFPPATASVDLAWDASDPDGDDLLYSVFYSPDDGVTWLDRSLEQSESGHRLVLQPHTAHHSAKVIVTDGVRSREAVVRFTVTQQLFLPNITH